MRIYVMRNCAGVQPGIFLESPAACFQDPQVGEYSIEITEKTDMKQMAYILRESTFIIGYDRVEKGRRTRIIIPTPHIVSICTQEAGLQYPEASE